MTAITSSPNMNHLWARLLIEELRRNGVIGFCISPGSRSTPLALAVSSLKDIVHHIHVDERGMGFYALNWAKATGKPTALICTSGTAVANYFRPNSYNAEPIRLLNRPTFSETMFAGHLLCPVPIRTLHLPSY
jgi:hypothetical protein